MTKVGKKMRRGKAVSEGEVGACVMRAEESERKRVGV